MSEIKVFENSELGKVRVSVVDGEPMFCLSDICDVIGVCNSRNVKARLDVYDVRQIDIIDSLGRNQQATFVTESGLYDVIIRSDSEKAKPFRRWVTTDVLPSIRKHGAYMTPETIEKTLTSPDFIIQLATQLKNEQEKRKQAEAKIEADKSKVLFSEAVEASKKSILIRELAKIITQNGYQIGEKQLYERLRKAGYLCSVGESRNQPSQTYMNMGLFEIKKRVIVTGEESKVCTTTVLTPKGVRYFVNKFLGKK